MTAEERLNKALEIASLVTEEGDFADQMTILVLAMSAYLRVATKGNDAAFNTHARKIYDLLLIAPPVSTESRLFNAADRQRH